MRRPILLAQVPLLLFVYFLAARSPFLPSSTQLASWACRMSWMSPSYIHITTFDKTVHPIADKYKLFLYREVGWDGDHTPDGQPVLYIPGNAGSMMQVRSIASSASRQYWTGPFISNKAFIERGIKPLDFFTADFNEALSAFHGPTLLSQSNYVAQAIPHILSLYDHLPSSSRPTSVILLGHSMGGVVARQAALLLSDPSQVHVILTLSTPHRFPPVSSDHTMQQIYSSINSPVSHSLNASLISVCGGSADPTLASDACALPPSGHNDREDETRLGVFTSGMIGTWTGVDHEAMVWCHQVRSRIARLLLEFGVGPMTASQRKEVAVKWLVGEPTKANDLKTHQDQDLVKKSLPSTVIHAGERFESGLSSSQQTFLYRIPPNSTTFDLLSTYTINSIGAESSPSARIFQCVSSGKSPIGDISLRCAQLQTTRLELIPPSPTDRAAFLPGEGIDEKEGMVFFQGKLDRSSKENPGDRWILVETDGKGWGVHSFGEPDKESLHVQNDRPWKFIFGGVVIDHFQRVNSRLHRQVSLINAISHSLLVYKVSFSGSSCTLEASPLFRPLLSHHTISSHRFNHEKSFYADPSAAPVYLHSHSAGVPFSSSSSSGFVLDLWEDPSSRCVKNVYGRVNEDDERLVFVQIDVEASLGRVALRYRAAALGWSVGVVAFVMGISLQQFRSSGVFPSFVDSMSFAIRTYTVHAILAIISLASIQTTLSFVFPTSQRTFALLLGVPGLIFVPFHVVCLGVSIGLVNVMLGILKGCIWLGARGLNIWKGGREARSSEKNDASFTITRFLPIIVLLGSVVIVLPYQVAFLVLYLIHFQTTFCSCSLNSSVKTASYDVSSTESESVSRSNFHISLLFFMLWLVPLNGAVLIVWVRDFMSGWVEWGGPDRSIVGLMGCLLIVEVCARGGFLRNEARKSLLVQVLQIGFFLLSACSFLIGSQHTFRLYSLSNGLLALAAVACVFTKRAPEVS
uniref:GPI inositol-deacylase n=1 Tax=Phaffia rhodozyma TaxID=264483 RepID=A0A1C9U6A3_PHARH|nr:GPI-inositol deacylase [Phaffia rhodozyma]